jgi:hypothetical protein
MRTGKYECQLILVHKVKNPPSDAGSCFPKVAPQLRHAQPRRLLSSLVVVDDSGHSPFDSLFNVGIKLFKNSKKGRGVNNVQGYKPARYFLADFDDLNALPPGS